MAVMARERWTDERLDKAFDRFDGDLRELRVVMRKGFEQIDKRFDQIDKRFDQIDKRFEQVDKRFEQVERRFERVDDKFDAMQRNMTFWFVSLFSAIVASLIAGVFAT